MVSQTAMVHQTAMGRSNSLGCGQTTPRLPAGSLLCSGVEVEALLQGNPLGDELLMAHQAVAGVLIGLGPVLVPQGDQLLTEGMEDRMVLVHRGSSGTGIRP